jgi:predicted nucleotidyltransferase component of viral defense system
MIPQNFITEWKNHAPWQDNAQIEQDLILSRAIVELFSNSHLRDSLSFLGGTALHKLYAPTQERYSEDLDFVQRRAEPIGDTLHHIHSTLNSWLGEPKWKQTQGRVTFYYRYKSEISPSRDMKIKIEINTREHHVYDSLIYVPFSVKSPWFQGVASVTSYTLEELMGTKMRALYQRKKGRDLFDLMIMLYHFPSLNRQKIIDCLLFYMARENLQVSRAEFEKNMAQKLKDKIFTQDILPLLHSSRTYNPQTSYEIVYSQLISLLPGDPLKKE